MGIHDPIEEHDPTKWFPSNPGATQLVACLLACKDVTRSLRSLARPEPLSDRRGFILLLTPVMSLLINVLDLNRMLERIDISSWPQDDRDCLRDHSKILRKRSSGPLRLLRNERSAHQDPGKFSDAQARARARIPSTEVLNALCETLFVLTLRLNHNQAYAWSRYPDQSRPELLELQQAGNVGPVRFLTSSDNQPTRLLAMGFGYPGLLDAKKIVDETIAEYNQVAALCSADLQLIGLRQRNVPGYKSV